VGEVPRRGGGGATAAAPSTTLRAGEENLAELSFELQPIASLAPVEALWRKLEAGSDVSFFVSWTWIGTWLSCLPEHIRPQLLVASRDGEAIGAAILVARRQRRRGILNVRQLHFNSTGDPALDCIWIEHNSFAAGAKTNGQIWPAVLRWFEEQKEADELLIPGIAEVLMADAAAGIPLLHRATCTPAFASAIPEGGREAILARLSPNTRRQLRRNLRDCEQLGALRIEASRAPAQALAWFEGLKALHMASWSKRGKRHAFYSPFFETFHRALISAGAEDGSVRLRRVSAGAAALGYLYDFRSGGRLSAYQSGFEPSLAHLRPGYVAHLLAMEQTAAEGARIYDFLGGDNQMKRSLGELPYAIDWHRFAQPKAGLCLEAAATGVVSWLRPRTRKETTPPGRRQAS
jgi:CelD/BcsL family acetyltransferase involved in cellulose biosynthesis